LLAWKGCENGNFRFKGTVYGIDSGIKKPLDSIKVTVLRDLSFKEKVGHTWTTLHYNEGTTLTDVAGHYEIHGITPYVASTYYLVFENPLYKADTVKVKKGNSVQRTYDHEMRK
jgi:hypothetical protein